MRTLYIIPPPPTADDEVFVIYFVSVYIFFFYVNGQKNSGKNVIRMTDDRPAIYHPGRKWQVPIYVYTAVVNELIERPPLPSLFVFPVSLNRLVTFFLFSAPLTDCTEKAIL